MLVPISGFFDARHPNNATSHACSADILGIHGNPLRALPLFLVYLAVLVHTYRSVRGSGSVALG